VSVSGENEEQPTSPRSRRSRRSSSPPRTAQDVIDQAIRDNKLNEYLLYGFATVVVLCGMLALIVGVIRGEGLVALAGGIASALFFPALRQARQIRRENIAIRLLERPLDMAETSREAAETLKAFFEETFLSKQGSSEDST